MTENLQNTTPENERIKELISRLNRASEAYYGGREELISNYEWDSLFDELSELEKKTGIIYPDSPTVRVSSERMFASDGTDSGLTAGEGEEDLSGNRREVHEYQALSLAKTKSVSELIEWADERPVYVSYKLDGLTLVLTYDDGELSKIVTRGNGTVGNNITILKDAIDGFPKKISYKGHLVVRGEATISYTDFELINALSSDDEGQYANPRNLASGTLSLDDPDKVRERHVCFNAFTLVHIDEEIRNWGDRMKWLEKEGFTVVPHERCEASEIPGAVERFTKRVEDGDFDIPVDGLVICYEDTVYAAGGSVTGHHATRAGLAFKWADVSADTTLRYVEWSCAASTISPVAVFEPVRLEGTTVSRASLCNLSEMARLGIREGCTLSVIKANKIIPKCIAAKGGKEAVVPPEKCPVCGADTRIRESEKSGTRTLHCENPDCAAKQSKKFERFVSKQGLDIDGLSIQTMIRFMNERYIASFPDIYRLKDHADAIRGLEGFGEKSAANILDAIERSRNVKAVNLIFALCIPMIGLDAAKKLVGALSFEGFLERLHKGEGFEDIDGIGQEKSGQILKWAETEANSGMLRDLLTELTVTDTGKKESSGGKCEGLTFVITGDVHTFKNRDELKAYIESEGGKTAGSVSGKTSFLINNDATSNSTKNRKAKELGVPILTEEEFLSEFGNRG
ncbi:MAG: NAD-dependent DNA ligase LigA [Lachnospiraceae bacterium]|nr:NAD-dependent DNA ligase LigA [Lachnospiraceae bacterium]